MDDGKAPTPLELARAILCLKEHRSPQLATGGFQGRFFMPWPPTPKRPKVWSDLLFTRNHGDKIATPRTRLDRKVDWDDSTATLRQPFENIEQVSTRAIKETGGTHVKN